MKMFEELIKVENGKVSARELHEGLEIKTPFHKWIPRMIEYGFEENKDFVVEDIFVRNSNGGKQTQKDYVITLDMAKEISMIQRSELGKRFRQYFIECEKFIQDSKLTEEFKYYRETGKVARKNLTDTIKQELQPSNNFVYKNYTELAYQLAFGKDTKQLKEELHLGKKDNLRDNLDPNSLKEVLEAEENIKGMIKTFTLMKLDKKEIYSKIKEIILKQ